MAIALPTAPVVNMVAMGPGEEIRFLPIVKAYPAFSQSYGEVSCIAGIAMGDYSPIGWIRLYPVPFRALDGDQKFAKYQPFTATVSRTSSDSRPETRRPDLDSIKVVGTKISTANGWNERRPWVEPLFVDSMCEIQRRQASEGLSLGIFRPAEVQALVIEPVDIDKAKEQQLQAWASQSTLLQLLEDPDAEKHNQLKALEIMPFRFKYKYRCSDENCNGHEQSLTDWEVFELYRKVRVHSDWKDRVRAKFVDELCGPAKDTAFVVGNQHQHPSSFLVLTVWWPPKAPDQTSLPQFLDH